MLVYFLLVTEMCGHLQKLVRILCGQYEEQQTERHQDSLETQQVKASASLLG